MFWTGAALMGFSMNSAALGKCLRICISRSAPGLLCGVHQHRADPLIQDGRTHTSEPWKAAGLPMMTACGRYFGSIPLTNSSRFLHSLHSE